ncbi:MAG: TnpV protein [Clostridium sp.]|jgi:hypothetical protein|nr:TnpV protein [Clostridium sp.]
MSEITYTNVGDYLLPNIALFETPNAEPLGRYGRMRRAFLRENKKALYNQMLMTETLFPHLQEIDKAAQARFDVISDSEVAHEIILVELVYV